MHSAPYRRPAYIPSQPVAAPTEAPGLSGGLLRSTCILLALVLAVIAYFIF